MIIGKLLNPKLDYVFKRIFGSIGSEEITKDKDFLRAITKENITDIKLDCNPITEKDLYDDKISILDIKAKLNNNINCNIEMQIVDRKNIEKRIMYYWSKMYTGSIKWQIREEKTPKLILTDVLEIFIIELRKVSKDKQKNDTLKAWLEFINNPEEKSKMGDKEELIKAREILEDMSRTKRERYLAEQREKWIMDKHAIHAAGYDKGLQAGEYKKRIEIAKKMKEKNYKITDIVEMTGLTKEEIEKL